MAGRQRRCRRRGSAGQRTNGVHGRRIVGAGHLRVRSAQSRAGDVRKVRLYGWVVAAGDSLA